MYKEILLPFDGSDGAAAALHHAAEIAHWGDATIHVLFVADTTRDSVTVIEGKPIDALVDHGEDVVEQAEKTLQSLGVDYETDVVQGNPAPTIAEYAGQYGYDLIVMPTHGRGGISRYLIGSVTEKVIRLSSVPVLTVRMQSDERLSFKYENILIPTDGSAGAVHAAEHGLALATAVDATVHVLSVVDDAPLGLDGRSAAAQSDGDQAATDAIADLASEADRYGVQDTVTQTERGKPAEKILEYIDSNDIDAVVMGATGRRGTERILLGSVAGKTARSAPVPVITVSDES